MIVNTVPPDAVKGDTAPEENPVAGRIGPDAGNPVSEEANQATDAGPNPDYEGEQREECSAKVGLELHLENGGSVVDLAQVGPDFFILPANHGHLITAGTKGMLHVSIDGKSDPVPVELTQDVDISTTRFSYKKINAIAETQTELSKADRERLFWEEVRLLGELRENESQRSKLDAELAAAKDRQRELQTELNNLSMRIPKIEEDVEECCEDTLTLARALWRLKQPASEQSQQPAAIEPPASEQPAALPTPQEESTEWRNLETAELLDGITGLGKKKLQGICELAPTVGDLEDLRGEGSKQFKQFHEMLPKGCGQGIASMIEDRLTLHVRKHSKNATGGNPLADELLNVFRHKVASESWQPSDCVPDSNDTDQTHLGFAAFNEGKPHSALPTQNPELARQWMLGWVCAEVIKHAPPASESEAKELAKQQKTEASAEPNPPEKKARKRSSSQKKSK